MKTAKLRLERVALVCPECSREVSVDTRLMYGDTATAASHTCPHCTTRYRVPALAFRVGKEPR